MVWTVVVPFKAAAERKSRLASVMDARRRTELSDLVYRHVVDVISGAGLAEEIITLTSAPSPVVGPVTVRVQQDPSLNAELTHLRTSIAGPMMVVNADLPLLDANDLVALATGARMRGCAVAPDRHGTGTNAVALMPEARFAFAFGPDSLRLHVESATGGAAPVERRGLAHDLDTLADIEAILALNLPLPPDVARLLRYPVDKGANAALAAGD